MSIDEITNALISERDRLNVAIAALQGAAAPKRRGRPPKNRLVSSEPATRPKRRRRRFTREQREAQAERMRQFWAQRRKKLAKG